MEDYKKVDERLKKIGSLAQAVRQIQLSLESKSQSNATDSIIEKVKSDVFRVLVLGEFSAGKSTFINALLGRDVLPSKMTPTTAIISELKWAETPRAVLYHRAVKGQKAVAEQVPVDRISDYIVIKDSALDRSESPFEKLELFWNLEFLKSRVEIIDSPGLNDTKTSQQVTTDYLGKVDAVLFVMSCSQLASAEEMLMVEHLRNLGHTNLFFICNRYDDARKQSDRDDLRRVADARLAPKTDLGREGIYFISALQALDGREGSDPALVEKSGLPPLEAHLQRFLTRERGRIKVLQPAKQLSDIIAAAQALIPEREAMLHTERETLEERYHRAKAPLEHAKIQRANIGKRIANFRSDMKEFTQQKACEFYIGLENKVPGWLETYEIKAPFKILSTDFFSPKGSVERVVEEVTDYLSSCIEQESAEWQHDALQPFLQSRFEDLKNELDLLAQAFLKDLSTIKAELLGVSAPPLSGSIDAGNVSPLERILSAAGSLWLGDPVGAVVGYTFGFKTMLGNLALQIGILAVSVIVGITNPVILLALVFGGGGVGAIFRGTKTNEQIKKKIGQMFVEKIHEQSAQLSAILAGKVYEKLGEVENDVDTGLGRNIASIEEQVESVLSTKHKGEEATLRELATLKTARENLSAAKGELDTLIHEAATV